jgi:hypothetical protein
MNVITNARYFGIKIHGSENISKIKKHVHGLHGVELSGITLSEKAYENAVFLHDQDEFSGISLGQVLFCHCNSSKEIIEEVKSWESRPYKHLVQIVKDAKLTQQSNERCVFGEEWWDGPDWFVFSEGNSQENL